MRKYYYSVGGTRVGPVTIEELKVVRGLSPETLVWYNGLSSWLRAGDVAELSELFAYVPSSSPPPIVVGGVYAPSSLPSGEVQSMFAAPFSFDGRIRRLEYGLSFIISLAVIIFSTLIFGDYTAIDWIFIILANWFNYAQGCKRSHDVGKSGWWQLIPFYCLYILFAEGDRGENEYGSNPKGE
jgi:uncharacterized membrane protein YhaH (DUF805 family)